MTEINCAFVGCGGIAERYINVYRDLPWVRVLSCVDADLARAQKASQALKIAGGPTPVATNDFSAALEPAIDIVVINTPNYVHRQQAIAAMKAGKHVLLQKPVAASMTDARAIAEAAAKAEKSSGLYMSYFDQPLMHDLCDMQRSGWFGDIVHIYAKLMHTHGLALSDESLQGHRTWRGSVEQTGGGCFIQLAVHYIHLFYSILGERPVRVAGVTSRMKCLGLEGEDLASAILQYKSGAIATIDTAWCATGEQLSIHGTKGSASYVNNHWLTLTNGASAFKGRVVHQTAVPQPQVSGTGETDSIYEVLPPEMDSTSGPCNQHRVFLEAVRDGKKPFVSIASGVDDMAIVEAAYRSAKSGQVEVPVYFDSVAVKQKTVSGMCPVRTL